MPFYFMILCVVLASLITFFFRLGEFRGKKRIIIYAFITGGIIAFLNSLIEFFALKLELYRIDGPFRVLGTPLTFFISWWLLTYSFLLIFWTLIRKSRTIAAVFVILSVFLGLSIDFWAWKNSILIIMERGHWIFNLMVWLTLVPLSVFIFVKLVGGKKVNHTLS